MNQRIASSFDSNTILTHFNRILTSPTGDGCWDWVSKQRAGGNGEITAEGPPASGYAAKYGFYIHVFDRPAAVIHQIRQINLHFPGAPIYIMSDGGDRFDELCRRAQYYIDAKYAVSKSRLLYFQNSSVWAVVVRLRLNLGMSYVRIDARGST